MDTAETAIIVSGVVGALGVVSPIANSWVQRNHERQLARSARLHDQRLDVYRELGRFLEADRLRLARIEPDVVFGEPLEPPDDPTDEDWMRVQADSAIAGSEEIQQAVRDYYMVRQAFIGHVFTLQALRRHDAQPQQLGDSHAAMRDARAAALRELDSVEDLMRVELEQL